MSNKDTGGPAFPIHWENHAEGMTLRDYFAAKAMQAMVSSQNYCEGNWEQNTKWQTQ